MNGKPDLKHTVLCIAVYAAAILIGVAVWGGVYVALCALGIVPWRAVVETALIAVATAAVACRLVGR